MKLTYIRPALAILLVAIMALAGRPPAYAATELIVNGSFEASQDGLPQGWTKDGYKLDESVTAWTLEQGSGSDPAHYVRVASQQPNDARWLQRSRSSRTRCTSSAA